MVAMTPKGDEDEDGLMCDLLDANTKEWKWSIKREMFPSHEVTKINMLYVSRRDLPYELVWHFDTMGIIR